MSNKGVRAEAEVRNSGIFCRKADLQTVYRRGEDGGIHQVTRVVGPRIRLHAYGEGGIVK